MPRADADHGGLDATLTLALVAVPFVAGLLITPRALGAAGLDGTAAMRLVIAFDGSAAVRSSPPPPPKRPIADVPDLMAYLRVQMLEVRFGNPHPPPAGSGAGERAEVF